MIKFQLWCYYETQDVWKMEGFFRTKEAAQWHVEKLRDDVETPCMPDWEIVCVQTVVTS